MEINEMTFKEIVDYVNSIAPGKEFILEITLEKGEENGSGQQKQA